MDMYTLEFFVEKLIIGSNQLKQKTDFLIHVKCSDIVDINIKYFVKLSAINLKATGVGKAIVFSCTPSKLVAAFTSDFRAAISSADQAEITIGTAFVTWPHNFGQFIKDLGKSLDHIQHNIILDIKNEESKQIGTMQIQMCLVSFGTNIEVPISYLGSQIAIPFTFRKTKLNNIGSQIPTSSEQWEPMFFAPKKPTTSLMDPGMEFYAEMAGVTPPPPMSSLLTPEYINQRLCGNKGCPGAQKFKEFGLGPLAPEGSCLGTVASIKNSKPLGIYGMSQAYGTMDNYGAYGLFVKKPMKPKTCCGSPDCPYTIFFGKPDVIPSDEKIDDWPKKCQCKNCRKNNGSKSSKQSSKGSSTCGSPKCPYNMPKVNSNCGSTNCPNGIPKVNSNCGSTNCPYGTPKVDSTCDSPSCPYSIPKKDSTCGSSNCPKKTPKAGVPCPFLNNSRQSAGADRYNPDCPGKTCPYSTNQLPRRQSGKGGCGGQVCPLQFNSNDEPLTAMDSFVEAAKNNCKDTSCPFYEASSNCEDPSCPINEVRSNCKDPSCPINEVSKICKDKTCPFYEESESGPCGRRVCPLDKQDESTVHAEDIFGEYSANNLLGSSKRACINPNAVDTGETKRKILSLLINEDGKQILLSANGDNKLLNCKNLPNMSKELLATLSATDNSDIYFLISRLVAERQGSYSLNNYYSTGGAVSSPDFKNDEIREVKKRKGPCRGKKTCKFMTYKTCSECGGVSKSGATCDNTDVSFSTISYDSFPTTGVPEGQDTITDELGSEKPKTPIKSAVIKKKVGVDTPGHLGEKLSVKIARRRRKNSRFVYCGGENYPGIRSGHKTCVIGYKNVPAHMGWLWTVRNAGDLKRKKGWKPGVMCKVVEERIIQNRRAKGIPDPPELKMLVKKAKFPSYREESEEEEEEIEAKPTLTIEKKEGNYLITMNPLKDPKTLVANENPYMRCKPMQFLIIKPKKEPPPAPVILGSDEYDGEDEGEEYYDRYYNNCTCDDDRALDSSSSSESELNIEFTTPAGIINPEAMKKPPNVVNTCTQFKIADFDCEDCTIIIPKQFKKERKRRKR